MGALTHRVALALLFAIALVGCDQGTKALAVDGLKEQPPISVAGEVVELRYAENTDVGFALLGWLDEPVRYRLLLVLVPLVALAIGGLWWRRRRGPLLEHLAYAAMIAGALGNYLDRLTRGFVVDFIALPHYPVFNVADIAVAFGAIALWLAHWRARPVNARAHDSA
ncbi:MAG: signal peptidase II [Sandaracinus sp.]|nr:signal peptidase II [Sandaracinus sp.]|tara:strand:+ start:88 stop:588 length:501 start_codon:yes stop_codon:yes gene_type:complete